MNDTVIEITQDQKIYIETAHAIGKSIAREAIWYKDMCNWTGHEVCLVDQNYVNAVKSCGIELYSGLSGIALFLSTLYERTQDPVILHTLEGALRTIDYNLTNHQLNNYGYYSGKIGLGFTLWKIGIQLHQEELQQKGLRLVRSVHGETIDPHEVDIISGAAGSIPALLKLYYAVNDDVFLQMAIDCGEFLVTNAIRTDTDWSWKTVDLNYALTGFSHGASGIACSLLELYASTKNETYWHAAMGGFRYEKKWFNEQTQNWPDLRQYDGKGTPNYGIMWCHGAPGIAIAHLKAYEMTQQEFFLQEAKVALQTTVNGVQRELQPNSGTNYSLCHGIAGNSDILLLASDVLQDTSYRTLAEEVGQEGIRLYKETNTLFPSGVNDPSGVTQGQQENPGLMLGASGTGMFYLRLADSQKIPSALVP